LLFGEESCLAGLSSAMGNKQSKDSVKARVDHASKTGVLALQQMKLKDLPPQLYQLTGRLRSLSLQSNMLKAIPPSLQDFKGLKILHLDHNQLRGLPAELASLKKLETLSLSHNAFQSIPSCIAHIAGLRSLSLASNQISVFTPEVCGLKKLETLDLSANQIAAIPAECGSLTASELNLDRNQIAVIPAALAQAGRLKVLRVEENCIDRTGVPTEFLRDSPCSLFVYDGNPVMTRQLQGIEGFDAYSARFTATKKKFG